jgi:hypothetical protein
MSIEQAKSSDTKVFVATGTAVVHEKTWPLPDKEKPPPPDGSVLPDAGIVRRFPYKSWPEEGETMTFHHHFTIPDSALVKEQEDEDEDGPPPLIDQTRS